MKPGRTSLGADDSSDELLSAYLDNALTADERRTLDARLSAEPDLRATLDNFRAIKGILNAAPELVLPRDFRLDRTHQRRPRAAPRVTVGLIGLAASVVLIASVLLTARNVSEPGQAAQFAADKITVVAIIPTSLALPTLVDPKLVVSPSPPSSAARAVPATPLPAPTMTVYFAAAANEITADSVRLAPSALPGTGTGTNPPAAAPALAGAVAPDGSGTNGQAGAAPTAASFKAQPSPKPILQATMLPSPQSSPPVKDTDAFGMLLDWLRMLLRWIIGR